MFSHSPKLDLCECLKPFLSALLATIFLLFFYLTRHEPYQTRNPGYFKRKRAYSFEEEFAPKKG